jgi:SMEK domain
LLNRLYGFHLHNLNILAQNFGTIDLGDEAAQIAIQVTSRSDLEKVRTTVSAYGEKQLNDQYGHLVVLNIGAPRNHQKQTIKGSNGVELCTKADIWTIADLVKQANHLDLPALQSVHDFLVAQLPSLDVGAIPKEIETFMRLIELLSAEVTEATAVAFQDDPDPDGKINERFADHAAFLKSLYVDLYSEYGATYEASIASSDIGPVRMRRLGLHLKVESDTLLNELKGDPRAAFATLVVRYSKRLAHSGVDFDESAIRFFLVDQLIRCNIFPNKVVVLDA